MNDAFFAAVRKSLFNGGLTQSQVDGINAICEAWAAWGDGDPRKLAYVLGTAYHETARTMQPITEYGSQAYLRSKKYWPFVGRGYVQLTWLANYTDWGKRLGIDLAGKPELALRADYAGRILVQGMMLGTFTGKKLSDYITVDKVDFVNARRIVNGTDKAALIAGHANDFLAALKAVPKPKPSPRNDVPDPPPLPEAKSDLPEVSPTPVQAQKGRMTKYALALVVVIILVTAVLVAIN